jgi:hypothetical protein
MIVPYRAFGYTKTNLPQLHAGLRDGFTDETLLHARKRFCGLIYISLINFTPSRGWYSAT